MGGIDEAARNLEAVRTGPTQRAAQRIRSEYIEPQVSPDGPMPRPLAEPRLGWQRAHDLRQSLDEQSGTLRRASDPTDVSTAGGAAEARDVLGQLMNRAAEDVDPALRETWRTANRRYALRSLLNDQSNGSARRLMPNIAEAGELVTNPTGAPQMRLAAGLYARYSPALRTRTLQAIVPQLRAMGPRAARWADTLEQASRRGNTALATAHFAMSRQDPDYRQAVERMQQEQREGQE